MKNVAIISIVGGESLAGRELRDLLAREHLPVKVNLVGVDEGAVKLTEQDGEPAIITPLDEENLLGSQVVFLTGSTSSSQKALGMAAGPATGPALIDLTYAAEDEPSARLRAPMVEPPGFAAPAGVLHVIAHPAAIALALFLTRLAAKFSIRRATAYVFEPASERGMKGLEELRQQTVSLLSFQSMRKEVFDEQLSFNMLAQYGSQAPEALESVELRIERHLTSLLSSYAGVPLPSIRLVQAPVFHCYGISAHVEFDESADRSSLEAALASPEVDVRGEDLEPPNNAGIAGQGGIAVGAISADRNDPRAFWFWVVADNFRLMAENALAVARPLLPAPVSGGAR
jgi:aspartate-semialdehyde dehydrogenase